MKKLASDLTLPADLVLVILISSLAFLLGGLLCGALLLVSEWPWGYLIEGAVGGLLLGIFLRRRYPPWQVMVSGAVSIALGVLAATALAMLVNITLILAMLAGGAVAGALFGAGLNARKALAVFILTGAIGFGIGQAVLTLIRANFTVLYDWVALQAGSQAAMVLDAGQMGLYHGVTFGVAIVLTVILHRKELLG